MDTGTAGNSSAGGSGTMDSSSTSSGSTAMGSGSATASGSTAAGTRTETDAGSASLSESDRTFMMTAAQSDLLEQKAAKLATEKAQSGEVKEFAQMLATDHMASSQQLKQLAQSKGVQLPESLDASHQAKVQMLESASGTSFDSMFARDIGVAAHEQAVNLFEQASNSPDAEIRSFAQAQLPALRQHLEEARELEKTTSTRAASAQ